MRDLRAKFLKLLTHRWVVTAFLSSCLVGAIGHMSFGCSGWDPRRPFERNNPDVDRAVEMLEDGQIQNAQDVLNEYLKTKVCDGGKIGLPEDLRNKADGTFDLGLVLFYLAEKYGERFGDEDKLLEKIDAGEDLAQLKETAELRDDEVKCGLIVALGIAKDPKVPTDLRARAYYLAGNMEFLRLDYGRAIASYEEALKLIPGVVEEAGGDGIGRDAAWNRAVALRRLEKLMEDAGADAGEDAGEDAPQQGPQPQDAGDGGKDQDGGDPNSPDGDKDGGPGQDGGDPNGLDAGGDSGTGDNADAGPDGGQQDQDGGDPQNKAPDAGDQDPNQSPQDPDQQQQADPQPADPSQSGPSSPDQGNGVLDRFDQTPTYQQEEAKKRGDMRRRNTEDK